MSPKRFSLYALASNKPGKHFTEEEFLAIVNAEKPFKTHKEEIRLKDGYVYQGSSKEEIRLIRKLQSKDAFVHLRGQCIAIPYRFDGKDRTYHPDLLVYTKTGRIIVVEVKQIAQMSSKVNQRKYKALKAYCQRKGYLYLMCDKSLRTYEQMKKKCVYGEVETAIERVLNEKRCFTKSDYHALIQGKAYREVNRIRFRIGRYVASRNNEVKQIGDLTYDINRFRIIRKHA